MMSKRLVTVALLTTLSVGCAKGAMVGGGVMAGMGVMMIAGAEAGRTQGCAVDDYSCSTGWDDLDNDIGTTMGVTTLVLGAAVFLAGAAIAGRDSEREAALATVVRRSPRMVVTGAPGSVPAAYVEEAPVDAPAPADVVEVGLAPDPVKRALPAERALRAKPANRLAMQMSVLARGGQCAAAVVTGERLAALDPGLYAEVVAADPAFTVCLTTRASL